MKYKTALSKSQKKEEEVKQGVHLFVITCDTWFNVV